MSLTSAVISGIGFTLSEVRDKYNKIIHPNQIYNYQVKSLLKQKLCEGINSCSSTRKNEYLMLFSASLSADDVAQKVRSMDVIKDAAHILHKKIKSCTFGLERKHCEAFGLQDAWANGKIKENAETFLAALFNLNRIAINVDESNKKEIYLDDMILDPDDDSDNIDDETTETPLCRTITKRIPAYSIYQMMVYTVTDGKIKTPLHVMTGQSVYFGRCSCSTITSLNKISVSISYDDV